MGKRNKEIKDGEYKCSVQTVMVSVEDIIYNIINRLFYMWYNKCRKLWWFGHVWKMGGGRLPEVLFFLVSEDQTEEGKEQKCLTPLIDFPRVFLETLADTPG